MSTPPVDDGPLNITELLYNTTNTILTSVNEIVSELKDANSEFNWDPPTFIVTSVIGLIALFFALLTIVQAIWTAGPGRLKCGRYAIGPWSTLNNRQVDFAEVSVRTIASTPIIKFDDPFCPTWERGLSFDLRHGKYRPSKLLQKTLHEYFPATWLAFLTFLNVDEPELWNTKTIGADYIPSELAAVPAYGTVRALSNLALIGASGKGRIEPNTETGFPSIRADEFELNFRNHPFLGVVGSFETYFKDRRQQLFEICYNLSVALGFAHGWVFGLDGPFLGRRVNWIPRPASEQEDAKLSSVDSLKIVYAEFCKDCECNQPSPPVPPAAPKEGLEEGIFECGPSHVGLIKYLGLAYADLTMFPIRVFPQKSAQLLEILESFILLNEFWSMGVTCHGIKFTERPLFRAGLDAEQDYDVLSANLAEWRRRWNPVDEAGETLSRSVIRACRRFLSKALASPKSEERHTAAIKAIQDTDMGPGFEARRIKLVREIKIIDNAILRSSNRWKCRAIVLSFAAWEASRMGAVRHDGDPDQPSDSSGEQFDDFIDPRKRTWGDLARILTYWFPDDPHRGDIMNMLDALRDLRAFGDRGRGYGDRARSGNRLDTLLIYRIILNVMVLSLATDNSAIAEGGGTYDRIIPIL